MIETILHILGLCPDSISHPDLIDLLSYYYAQTYSFIYNILKFYNMYK